MGQWDSAENRENTFIATRFHQHLTTRVMAISPFSLSAADHKALQELADSCGMRQDYVLNTHLTNMFPDLVEAVCDHINAAGKDGVFRRLAWLFFEHTYSLSLEQRRQAAVALRDHMYDAQNFLIGDVRDVVNSMINELSDLAAVPKPQVLVVDAKATVDLESAKKLIGAIF